MNVQGKAKLDAGLDAPYTVHDLALAVALVSCMVLVFIHA